MTGATQEGERGLARGSAAQHKVVLSRAPVGEVRLSAGEGRAVKGQAPPPAEHLLLQLDDVVTDVGHHEQQEVKRAG